MFTPRKLNRPPIREAIYTISFKEPIPLEKLANFRDAEFARERFPTVTPGFVVEVSGEMNKPGITTRQTPDGFSLQPDGTDKSRRLVQLRPTYLSYHNMTAYDGWDVMITELRELWSEFCKTVGKNQLVDVRVRNINHIGLPLPLEGSLGDYVRLLPQVPEGINPNLSNFFLQIQTSDPEKNLQATITGGLLNVEASQQSLPLLLDITVYKSGVFDCSGEELWQGFDELRAYKDDLFFKCITERTEQLFI